MPDQIFISYRRDDAAYVTGHINDELRKEFGDQAVFTDVDNIALGVDFRAVLDRTVSQCQVLLAVVGSNWLSVKDQDGQPRLQDPADFVRIEIESALKRDIPVIPLLVSGATMPAAEDLPDSLQGFAFRNGTQIRPAPDFSADMARLIKNLRRHFDSGQTAAGDETREEPAIADDEVQQGSPSQPGESPGISLKVGDEERARHQADVSRGAEPKRGWIKGLGLIAVVGVAGAGWYFFDQNQGILQSGPALEEPEVFEPAADVFEPEAAVIEPEQAVIEPEPDEFGPEVELIEPEAGADAVDAEMGPPAAADAEVESDADENLAPVVEDEPEAETAAEAETEAETQVETEVESVEEVAPAPVVERQPDAAELIGEGVRLAAIGAHEEAIQSFDKALELDAEQPFVYKQRGASYQALEQYEAAVSDYDEAIRLNAEDVNAYYRRGASHFALQDYAAAIADFDTVIEYDPGYVDAYSRRADAHEAMGNTEAAARDREVIAD
jgi:tetratricopeptide (TPR) repeat protein